MRDEFAVSVRNILAARAGHRCSNPGCRASTSGPQLDDEKALNLGVAAHITGAAEGGPRFDDALSREERQGIDNAIWLCQNCAKLIDNDPARFSVQILHQWRNRAERHALQEIGKPAPVPTASDQPAAEREIERKLKLRTSLEKELLLPPEKRTQRPPKHPYEKFERGRIIVRSLEDQTYPEMREESQWFRAEPFDFYHNGLELVITIRAGIISDEGMWNLIPYGNESEPIPEGYRKTKMWVIGRIPYRLIRATDYHGDEYYNAPHLYCVFAHDGSPYEEIRYALVGKDDEYDWPLDNARRLPENGTSHVG